MNNSTGNLLPRSFHCASFAIIALIAVGLLSYASTINNGFKLDDFTYLPNPASQDESSLLNIFTQSTNQHYNPLNILINKVLFRFWGNHVVPFRLLNIVLFLSNGLLWFIICQKLTRHRLTALLAAGLFILHPLNAEMMNQIVFNTVLLSAVCFQLSVLYFDKYLTFSRFRDHLVALAFATVSFLTLETAWLLPFFLALWAKFHRECDLKKVIKTTFFFWVLVSVFFILWYRLSQGNALDNGFIQKFTYLQLNGVTFWGTLAALVAWYLSKLLWPINHIWIFSLAPISYNDSLWLILAFSLLIIGMGVILVKSKHSAVIKFSLLWFISGFIFVFPGSLTHPDYGMVIEPYWFYLNSIGFFLLLGILLVWLKQRVPVRFFTVVVFLLGAMLFFFTQRINFISQTEKRYSEYWMQISPNPIPLTALAKISYAQQDYAKTIAYYHQYLNQFASSPYSVYTPVDLYISIGGLYAEGGDLVKARQYLKRGLEIDKNDARGHHFMAGVEVRDRNYPLAEQHYQEVLRINPDHYVDLLNLADLYLIQSKNIQAIPFFEKLTQAPLQENDLRNVFSKLAVLRLIYVSQDAFEETKTKYFKADAGPQAILILAQALDSFGKPDYVKRLMEEKIQENPQEKDLYIFYGVWLGNRGELSHAIAVWQMGEHSFPQDSRFKEYISQAKALQK